MNALKAIGLWCFVITAAVFNGHPFEVNDATTLFFVLLVYVEVLGDKKEDAA